jgi:hypothetical protein
MIAFRRNDAAEAQALLDKALERDEKHANSLVLQSRLKAGQGDVQAALKAIGDIDKLKDWRSVLGAGNVLFRAGRYKQAHRLHQKAVQLMNAAGSVPDQARQEAEHELQRSRAEILCLGFGDSIRSLALEAQRKKLSAKVTEIHGKDISVDLFQAPDGKTRLEMHYRQPPLRWLQPFRGLVIHDLQAGLSQVDSFEPLRGMLLRSLCCHYSSQVSDSMITRVKDLSPLRGMMLDSFRFGGPVPDLDALSGMPLTHLTLTNMSKLTDIGGLKGLPLKELQLSNAPKLTDLSPLAGLSLNRLILVQPKGDLSGLAETRVEQLEISKWATDTMPGFFRNMSLKSLRLNSVTIPDFSFLKGMKLEVLHMEHTRFSTRSGDLTLLDGMPLKTLKVAASSVRSLKGIERAPLTSLEIGFSPVSDLTPLSGLPLTSLICIKCPVSDITPLKGLPLLSLNLGGTRVTDLTPLIGMRLTSLQLDGCPVTDLSALKGIPLTNLSLSGSKVTDLSPLKGIPLTNLNLSRTEVADLTPIADMPLTGLHANGVILTPESKAIVKQLKERGCKVRL